MLRPTRTVAPSVDLLTPAEVKAHCRVDTTDDDNLLTMLIAAATSYLDGYSGILGRALLQQTWKQSFEGFTDDMRLAVGDLIGVTSVKYYDASNVQWTLAGTVYTAAADEIGPYLDLAPGQSWPATYARDDAVEVTWTAGYGTAAASVPAAIRQAALLLIGHWYANREAVNIGNIVAEVPMAVAALIAPFRRVGV